MQIKSSVSLLIAPQLATSCWRKVELLAQSWVVGTKLSCWHTIEHFTYVCIDLAGAKVFKSHVGAVAVVRSVHTVQNGRNNIK